MSTGGRRAHFLTLYGVKQLFARMPAAIQKLGQQARAERREVARRKFKTQFLPPNAPTKRHRTN